MQFPITEFSLVLCYFLPLRSKYIHQHPQPMEITNFKFKPATTITLTQTLTLTVQSTVLLIVNKLLLCV
jgi:hypothetical protein